MTERLALAEAAWNNHDYQRLLCPSCNDEYQHLSEPRLLSGNDNYEAWEGRGDLVVVPIEGECGHEWNICLGHHKGYTFVFTEIVDG